MALNTQNYDIKFNIAHKASECLCALLDYGAIDVSNILYGFLINSVLNAFQIVLNISNFENNIEVMYNFQVYIVNICSSALLGMRFSLDPNTIDIIYKYTMDMFEQRKDIFCEGILLVGILCQCKILKIIRQSW